MSEPLSGKNVWVVELREDVQGAIERRTQHVSSSFDHAVEWIEGHQNLRENRYWFAVCEYEIDGERPSICRERFVSDQGKSLKKQPVRESSDERRAGQSGLSQDY